MVGDPGIEPGMGVPRRSYSPLPHLAARRPCFRFFNRTPGGDNLPGQGRQDENRPKTGLAFASSGGVAALQVMKETGP